MSTVANFRGEDLWPRWHHQSLLEAAFQPIVSLRDGVVLAYEGLSRPQLPEGQTIAVLDLMASAEQHDSLLTFDLLAFKQIIAAFRASRVSDSSVLFINILPKSLLTPVPFLLALQQSGLKPEQIVLEISERETIQEGDAKLREYLAPFRDMGIRIALDDMGSGYSGLTRLIELQPDFAKIDLTLVRDVDKNAIKFALLESTARFAKKTAATSLIAEGIETFAELYTLKEIGVEFGQGYLLGRPNQQFHSSLTSSEFKKSVSHKPSAVYQLDTLLTTTRQMVRGLVHGEGAYTSLTALAKRLTGADVAVLFKIEGSHFRYVGSSERLTPSERQIFEDTAIRQTPSLYQAIVTRQPAVCQQKPLTEPRPWSDHFHLESAIAAPICDNLGCWGLLHVGYHEPNQIRSDTIHLVESITALFVLALGYSQKEEAISDQDMLGEPLFEAISSLAESADLEHLLAKTTSAALAVTGGHEGWIGILNENVLHCVRHDGESFDVPRQDLFDPETDDGKGPVGQVLQTRTACIIPNIMNEPSLSPWLSDMTEAGIQSAAGIPLISGNHLLGILKVYHSQIGGFTPGRVRRLYALSSLATALIERSIHFLQSNERIRRQSLLAQSLAQMGYSKSRQEIFSLLTTTLARYGPFPLVLVLKREGGLFVPVLQKADDNNARTLRLPYCDDHAFTKALRSGQSLYVKCGDHRQDSLTQFATTHGFPSYAVIPLGLPATAVVLFSRDDESLNPLLPELESFTRAMGQALSKNLLQNQIAEEQQQMDSMLEVLKDLPYIEHPRKLWERVAQILTEQIGIAGGWILDAENLLMPRFIFGNVPREIHSLPTSLRQRHTPFILSEAEIPLSLREEGIKSLLGFHLTFPEVHQDGFLLVVSRQIHGFSKHQRHLMEILVSFSMSIYKIIEMRQQQEHQAHTDPLTRLPNDMGIEEFYRELQDHDDGQDAEVGCVLLDIVGLANINHDLGESVGTHKLIELSQYLRRAVKQEGIAGRIGSDEFMLVYPQLNAHALEEEIHEIVSGAPLPLRWTAVHVSHPRDVPIQAVLKTAYFTLHHKGSGCLEILSRV